MPTSIYLLLFRVRVRVVFANMHILSFQHVWLFLAITSDNMCHVFVDHLSRSD